MGKKPEKFFFNMHNFDDGHIDPLAKKRQEEEERLTKLREAEENRPPPPPTFSQEQLEAAKQAAYQDGFQKGTEEEKARQDIQKQAALDTIAAQIPAILASEEARITMQEVETLKVSLAIFQKLFPLYTQKHGMEELSEAIKTILTQNTESQSLQILVHPDHVEAVTRDIKSLDTQGQLTVSPSDQVAPGNCTIRWQDGGAEHRPDEISQKIHDLLLQTIEENSKKPPQKHIEDSPAPLECDTIKGSAQEKDAAPAQDDETQAAETPDDGDHQ